MFPEGITMIIAERKTKVAGNNFEHFGVTMPDGRLTASSDGKIYYLRETIIQSKKLGRPLMEEEMKAYEA